MQCQMLRLPERTIQSLAGANRDVMQTIDFQTALFFNGKNHMYCAKTSVRKIVNGELSKTLARALPCGTVWVDKPSPFVVSGMANLEFILNGLPCFFLLIKYR